MNTEVDFIAPFTPAEAERYAEAVARAVADGVISADAKPAQLGCANRTWSIITGE